MSLVESLHRKRQLFRASIAAQAVPDNGIDLKRKTIPIAHIEQVQEVPVTVAPAIEPVVHPAVQRVRTMLELEEQIIALTDQLVRLKGETKEAVPAGKNPSVIDMQKFVAERYNTTRTNLISQRRTAEIVWPRQLAMYLAKEMTTHSLPMIGRLFGGRDHTTILHAVRKVERLRLTNEGIKAEVQCLISDFEKLTSPVVSASQSTESADHGPGH